MNIPPAVFKPKYPLKMKLSFLFLPIMAILFTLAAIDGGDPDMPWLFHFLSLAMITLTGSIPFVLIRRIRFEDKILVDRFVVPTRELDYTDILDVGITNIRAKRGNLSLNAVKNVDEFKSMLANALAEKDIPQDQIESKLAKQETEIARATIYAQAVALPVTFVLLLLRPDWFQFADKLSFVLVYSAIMLAAFFAIKRFLPPKQETSQ